MKLIIADDSALIAGIMTEIFKNDPDIKLAGIAKNGAEVLELVSSMSPDLVIMDINMPVMDGITATRKITSVCSIPVMIFSNEINDSVRLAAYDAGAVEVISKPDIMQLNNPEFEKQFKTLIKELAASRTITGKHSQTGIPETTVPIKFIVMGASTGGPKTVRKIFEELPASLPVPVALVQHIEKGFDAGYAEWLNNATELTVELLKEPVSPLPGHVYVAPADRHIIFKGDQLISDDGPRILNQKPSVNVLFSSAALKFGSSLIGVLLTGMGKDGAEGCLDIVNSGGLTIVQDGETSDIFGMPKAAIEMNAATCVRPLSDISTDIKRLCASVRHG